MLGNIYLKTLRDQRGSILAWGLGLAAAASANVLFFPTMQAMPGMLEFLDNLPPAFKAMVGDVRAMVQLEGFLRIKLFDPLPLLLAIFIVPRGAALIAGEIELKSIDLLMARPVPRWRVAAGKFLALVTATVVTITILGMTLMTTITATAMPTRKITVRASNSAQSPSASSRPRSRSSATAAARVASQCLRRSFWAASGSAGRSIASRSAAWRRSSNSAPGGPDSPSSRGSR